MSILPRTIFNLKENINIYEKFAKEYFAKQGYIVWEDSKNKNISFMAKKNKRVLLIHCCENQFDISLNELKKFQEQRDQFKIDNPLFQNYDLSLHYVMSGFFFTEEAYAYLEQKRGDITYELIKGKSEKTWLETLVIKP